MSNILENINSSKDIKQLNVNELNKLSDEIREKIINTVSENGGHLASNLGMVEVTLALHKVFDIPKDSIIFDVGHQCYTHKIITGRKEDFCTLRQQDGISGFPKREESDCDCFNTGHSSTSISAAVGLARSVRLQGREDNVVAVIGDGALTGGMVWEAINDVGHKKEKLIIILNDNEMSISKNVGALSKYLSNLRTKNYYVKTKNFFSSFLKAIPLIGKPLYRLLDKIKDTFKYMFVNNLLFEEMGLRYYGILDGHDMGELITILEQCKEIKDPVIIHVKTKKGKGYKYATQSPDQYHSTSPFDIETGERKSKGKYSLPIEVSKKLSDMTKEDSRICVITAAMEGGCGLSIYKENHPKRFFDVGIAEAHAVTMAAGLAAGGMRPCFAVYSTFLQRSYDQIVHDVCLQNLPVTFIVYNSGIVGNDGETHHGIYDISFLRHIPNLQILSPATEYEAKNAVEFAVNSNLPTAVLLGNQLPKANIYNNPQSDLNKWQFCTNSKNKNIAVLSTSSMLVKCMDAIKKDNIYNHVDIINARSIKPLDTDLIEEISDRYDAIVTVEDNLLQGGFGSAVLETLNYLGKTIETVCLGYDDVYVAHGSKDYLYEMHYLDTNSIHTVLTEVLKPAVKSQNADNITKITDISSK